MNIRSTFIHIVAGVLLLSTFAFTASGQMCSNGSNVNKGSLTVTASWQNTPATGNNQKIYWTFAATAGSVYNFSNCNGPTEDTYLRLYNSSKTKLAENDNGPNCNSQNAALTWTCPTNGTYYIELTHSSCAKLNNNQILSYRKCEKPGVPANVTCSATGLTTATASWSAGSPAGSPTVTYYWVAGTSASVTYGNGAAQGSTTGTTAAVTGLSCNTTYYFRVYASSDCNGSPTTYGTSSAFTTQLPATPASVTSAPASISCGSSAGLSAISAGNSINWYTVASGGTSLGSSQSGVVFSVTPASTTTYYAEAYNGSCTNPTRTSVVVTVNVPAAPSGVTATPAVLNCSGTSQLNAVSAGNTIKWYTQPSGGTLAGSSASGANFSVTPSSTTTYYAESDNGTCANPARTAVVVTVLTPAAPSLVTADPPMVCAGTQSGLTASADGKTVNWYDAETAGNLLGTSESDSLFMLTIDSTTTIYAETYLSEGCVSNTRTSVIITAERAPVPGTVTGGGLMCPGNTTGQLTLLGHYGNISKWEMSDNYGVSWTSIASTDTVYSTSITGSGIYWFRAEVTNGACPSEKSAHAEVSIPPVTGISQITGNSVTCNITSPNNWVDILDPANNLIVSLFDSTGNNNLGNTSAELTIDPIVSYHPNTGEPYMQRHIKINVSSQGGAYVKLYFTQEELSSLMGLAPSIQSASDLAVTKYSDMQTWSDAKYFSDPIITINDPFPGVFSVQVGVSEFSEFFIHAKSGQGPLPIELVSFEANCSNGNALLTWATATEANNQFFTIERTTDMQTWTEAARVDGAGNSNRLLNYSATDEYKSEGMVYYRLRQTDYDGKTTTSPAVPLNCEGSLDVEVNYYPNPFRDELLVAFDKGVSKSANVMMYDATAKVILSRLLSETEIQRGVVVLNVSEIIPGIYTAEFISGKVKKAMTVVKTK